MKLGNLASTSWGSTTSNGMVSLDLSAEVVVVKMSALATKCDGYSH